MESKNRFCLLIAVFTSWMVTSFLCHECAKAFLELSKENFASTLYAGEPLYRFLLASILTTIQCMSCYLCVSTRSFGGLRATMTIGVYHILATLATNYSMAYVEAASTLAIKLTEPVTMAIAQRVIFKTPVTMETLISLPIMISGALIFSVQSLLDAKEFMGIVLAFTSNIVLTARNVAIKSLHLSGESCSPPVILRRTWQISALIASQITMVTGAYFLERESTLPVKTTLTLAFLLTSGIFHVTYSYISTNVVLKVMNIVSHSVANIFKRLLVVLLLYLLGRRHASMWNFSGLALATMGLYIYVQGKRTLATNCVTGSEYSKKHGIFASKTMQRTVGLLASLAVITFVSRAVYQQNVFSNSGYVTRGATKNVFNQDLAVRTSFVTRTAAVTLGREMLEFLSWRLVDHPEETDARAKTLTENADVVAEAQRVLTNLLTDLIGPASHVMLMEIAVSENKGDPAISAGEILLLQKINKTIAYYCTKSTCLIEANLNHAVKMSKQYAKDELVILMQGGGNMVGYSGFDNLRYTIIKSFPDRKIVILTQSIWMHPTSGESLKNASMIYSNNSNLVLFLRDRQSLAIAKENFHGVKHILAPDMAFGIGMVPRQMAPLYDVVWLRRTDEESTRYALPDFPSGISVHVSDWTFPWKSNNGTTDMETSFLKTQAGFQYLEMGRVVVTDRLHGHILSTLMDIPHVVIDNPPYCKLSSFGKSWTAGMGNVIRVDNGSLAVTAALELLRRFDTVLPHIGPRNVKRF